jgi:uncharacterized protein
MVLEGVVTNVTNFGAFVDVGVHQDGLVHISALAEKFVSDPHEVVKAGDIVTVKVMEVDAERKRIALTMRLNDTATSTSTTALSAPNERKPRQSKDRNHSAKNGVENSSNPAPINSAFAEAFAKAKKR